MRGEGVEERTGDGAGEGRQVATLLFADLCESTRLATELEAEDYADILTSVRAVLERVVPAHGGLIGQIYGDGALVLFAEGHAGPEAAVDAALAAALELHRQVEALPPVAGAQLKLHSGVHAGLVLMRKGDAAKGRFEALGLATSVAARLASAANPGEILVSDATLGPTRWRYVTEAPRSIAIDRAGDSIVAVPVSGLVHTVTLHKVTRLEASARSARGLSPFVGRRAELAEADDMLARARGARASALLFTAPPGQGKSRFAAEVADRARAAGFAILSGASEPEGEPLQPFRQMVRAFGDPEAAPAEIPGEVLQKVLGKAAMAPLVAGGAADPAALATAVREQIERLAAHVPVLLLLDDWQWADAASVQLLKSLTAAEGRVAMLLLARPPEPGTLPFDAVAELALPPLEESDGLDMIQVRVPSLDSVVAARIHRAAGGNPLYIEELCHLAAADGSRMPDVSGAGWFAASIEARYRRLPPPLAKLVRTAAVMGMTIAEPLLAEISGVVLDEAARAELARVDLLFPADRPGMLRFKHGLARDILYRLVASADRRALHARIAEVLATQEPDAHEALATHYAESGQPALAADHAEKAGNAAAAAAAVDRAQLFYRMALDALDKLPPGMETAMRWGAIVRRFAMIAVYDPVPSHISLFEDAARRARAFGDPLMMAQAEYWVGYAYTTTGSMREGLVHYRSGLALAESVGATALIGELRAAMGHAFQAMCDYPNAAPYLADASLLTYKGGQRSISACASLSYRAGVLADQGEFGAAYDFLEEALALVGDRLHQVGSTILCWYAGVLLWQGRPEDARQRALQALAITERTGNGYMNAYARAEAGYTGWIERPEQADFRRLGSASLCMHVRGSRLSSSMPQGWSADVAAMERDMPALRAAAARAFSRGRAGDLLGAAMAWRALARVAETPARARHCLNEAHAVAERRNAPHERAVTWMAEAERALRDDAPSAALEPLDRAQALFERLRMPWFEARAAGIRARL
jgi:class 3 adenylate cyclase/tetratricopeptide (TPR) repeat protein